jgi:hypothetical protein
MSAPQLSVVNKDGIVWVSRDADIAFRAALLAGVPPSLHAKMKDALSRHPQANAREYSEGFFGEELPKIVSAVTPLIDVLQDYLEYQMKLPGFTDWLRATGFGDHHKMIAVFYEWAQMKKTAH